MNKLSTSPDRGNFGIDSLIKCVQDQGLDPETDEHTQAMIKFKEEWLDRVRSQEADPEWQKDNLEYDLRTCEWIIEKCRSREEYAQNLYAAMCNRDFQKIDVMPILKDQTWSCTWRYAGGVVADLCGQGDYIDWYCSGIGGGDLSDDERAKMTAESIARCEWMEEHFVSEGQVTDEIREDLEHLGWRVLDNEDDSI
jgi:hypothetical protein